MKYTLRQLEVFLAAAHHENITLASKKLAMSQSAASEALKNLENQFTMQLFDRAGKSLQLNELGRLVRPQAESLLVQARELESTFSRQAVIGKLKVGATLSIGNYLAIRIMAKYMSEHPTAKVVLEVANTTTIAGKVRNFLLDIGLIEGECNDPELEVIPWRTDELVVFCAADHPLASKEKLSKVDLVNAHWILRETGSGTRQTFERAMHGLLPEIDITLELQHTEAIKRAVEAHLGIGCLSKITLTDAFKRGNLVPLRVPGRSFTRNFYFILHKEKYRSSGVKHWIKLCQQADYLS